MKFKTIAEFLAFKKRCPFCKQSLSPEISSYWNSSVEHSIKNVTLGDISWSFLQTTQYSYNTSMGQGSLFKFKFDITLMLETTRVFYKNLESHAHVTPAEFNKGFNASKVYIAVSCHNKECEYDYSISSMPIYTIDEQLEEIMLYSETFVLPKYRCSNVYGDKLYIYKRAYRDPADSSLEETNITADFHELTEENSKNIQKRISTIVTFS